MSRKPQEKVFTYNGLGEYLGAKSRHLLLTSIISRKRWKPKQELTWFGPRKKLLCSPRCETKVCPKFCWDDTVHASHVLCTWTAKTKSHALPCLFNFSVSWICSWSLLISMPAFSHGAFCFVQWDWACCLFLHFFAFWRLVQPGPHPSATKHWTLHFDVKRAEWAMAQSPRDCAKINEVPYLDTCWHPATLEKKSPTAIVPLVLPKYRKYPLTLHLPARLVLRRFQDAGHERLKVYLCAHCCGMKEGVDSTISSSISCDWLSTANVFATSRFSNEERLKLQFLPLMCAAVCAPHTSTTKDASNMGATRMRGYLSLHKSRCRAWGLVFVGLCSTTCITSECDRALKKQAARDMREPGTRQAASPPASNCHDEGYKSACLAGYQQA